MVQEIVLSGDGSGSKERSNAVLELSQPDNEFPINLDEVWMLACQGRRKSANELGGKFMKMLVLRHSPVLGSKDARKDCKSFPRNGGQDSGNGWGGDNKADCRLSVSCTSASCHPGYATAKHAGVDDVAKCDIMDNSGRTRTSAFINGAWQHENL